MLSPNFLSINNENVILSNLDTQTEDLAANIVYINTNNYIVWVIPWFPVLKMQFHQARVETRTRSENNVVIPQDQQLTKGLAVCTSHRSIDIFGKKCLFNTSDSQVQVQQLPKDDSCSEEEDCQPTRVDMLHELPCLIRRNRPDNSLS